MEKDDFLKKLQIELKISKNSSHTLKNYLKANDSLLIFLNKLPLEVKEEDIKLYLSEKLENRAASSTILFLSAIKYAYSNLLKFDPTINIKRPKREKKIPTVLTMDETKALLNSCVTKKSKLMLSLLYATGMRVSEITNLELKDLIFEEGFNDKEVPTQIIKEGKKEGKKRGEYEERQRKWQCEGFSKTLGRSFYYL